MLKILNNTYIHLILIALLGLLVYSNTFDVPFQFDDKSNIAVNPLVKNLSYYSEPSQIDALRIPPAWSTIWKSRFVGYLTLALNYNVNGLDTAGDHVVNLVIHLVNALLVYLLVVLTFRTPFLLKSALRERSAHVALFSALIFVSHPVQTQAVTYIIQRFASLVTLFYLLSLIAYIGSRLTVNRAGHYGLYALSLISAVIAMKTKENAFTLPIAIILYEYVFFNGPKRVRAVRLIPLLLTMLIIPLTLLWANISPNEVVGSIGEATRLKTEMPRLEYLFTEFRVIPTYVRLMFLPINQNLDYDYPAFNSLFAPQVLLSLLFILSILFIGILMLRRSKTSEPSLRLLSFGIFWFFLTLSIESSIFPIADLIFEHRVYLPSIGMVILLSSIAFYMLDKLSGKALYKSGLALLIVFIVLLASSAYKRNVVWNDRLTLWSDVATKSPFKARPYEHLGVAYADRGDYRTAIKYYKQALRLAPDNAQMYVNIGNALDDLGDPDAAIKMYKWAIAIDSNNPGIYYNLAVVYERKGDYRKALEQYKMALKINPRYEDTQDRIHVLTRMLSESGKQSTIPK